MTHDSTIAASGLCAVLLCTSASAQRTWTVKADGFADFVEIQGAFDAASPGDTIIVHSRGRHSGTTYAPATTSKGVSLLSTSSWGGIAGIHVTSLPASETFTMAGFAGAFPFTATNCAGRIHLDNLAHFTPLDHCGPGKLHIRNCAYVTFNFGTIWDVVIENSTVLITDAVLYGVSTPCVWDVPPVPPPYLTNGFPALRMTNSDVTIVRSGIWGSRCYPIGPHPPVPGVLMNGGRLVLAGSPSAGAVGGGVTYVYPGYFTSIVGPAIESYGGAIVLDPDIGLVGSSPLVVGTSRVSYEDIPHMRIWHVYPLRTGWDIPVELHAPPGTSAVVCVSLPAPPLPTPFGDLWLDPRPGGIVPVAIATVPPTGKFETTAPFHRAWPLGTASLWQAVLVEPTGLRLSMPAVPVYGEY